MRSSTRTRRPVNLPFRFRLGFHDDRPLPSDACVQPPSYLHNSYQDRSLGHMLRDSFSIIATNLYALGLDGRDFRFVTTRPTVTKVARRYLQLVAPAAMTWTSVLDSCAGSRYLFFPDLVAGYGPRDLRTLGAQPWMCAPPQFRALRDRAYRRAGLPPAAPPPRTHIVLLDRDATDKRRISNVRAVAYALRTAFPDASVAAVNMRSRSVAEQLAELAATTVFVTTVGSASFRLILLPDSALVVLIGPPELRTSYTSHAFHEALTCWRYMQYLTLTYYHTVEEAEYTKRYDRKGSESWMTWDADVNVNATKLADIIASGLAARAQAAARGYSLFGVGRGD